MCICCEGFDLIKPMSEFTASELATANQCCLKTEDEDWNEIPSLKDLEDWVASTYSNIFDEDELFQF